MSEAVASTEAQAVAEKVVPLPGVICVQWVRCGKPGCRCTSGKLHGPYWYRFWRDGERQRKMYVRKADLERTRAACEAWQQRSAELQGILNVYNAAGWQHCTLEAAERIDALFAAIRRDVQRERQRQPQKVAGGEQPASAQGTITPPP